MQIICKCRIFYLLLQMSTRREKSKPQLNKQLEAMVEQRPKVNLRKVKERTSNYGNVFSRAICGGTMCGCPNLLVADPFWKTLDEGKQSAIAMSPTQRGVGHKGVRNLCVAPALQQKKSNDCDI